MSQLMPGIHLITTQTRIYKNLQINAPPNTPHNLINIEQEIIDRQRYSGKFPSLRQSLAPKI